MMKSYVDPVRTRVNRCSITAIRTSVPGTTRPYGLTTSGSPFAARSKRPQATSWTLP